MRVSILNRKSKLMKAFDKGEWKHYDYEHYGRDIEWDKKIYYLKVYEGKEILGTLELKVEGGVGAIKTLIVGHTKQRQGAGKLLMQKAEEITKNRNGHKLYLTTGENWKAVEFYKAMGFEKTGELHKHYFNVDFIEMSKFI